MNFEHSEIAQEYIKRISKFMDEHIHPIEEDYIRELHSLDNPWVELPIIKELKAKAREAGLWNLFMPDTELGKGLSNSDYAPLAELMGRSLIAPEVFNCNAPDTGNMEVLHHYGTDAQKEKWLQPLLAGEIRSAFCMTEPDVASSDATNMAATAIVEGDEVVINGRKWWTTGAGHPDCKIAIFMGLTDPNANRYSQHSMVLVPLDSPGFKVERLLHAFGFQDPPYGHAEVSFTNVRVPVENIIAGPGRGFEIAQGRLGPGRIHHCMRAIGAAEVALDLMCKRAMSRVAFGKPLAYLGGNGERIAEARIAIEQARLLTLKAAWLIDTKTVLGALSEVSQIKVMIPNMLQRIVDDAIQIHGGAGACNDTPLAMMAAYARSLRLADGPDEVHRGVIAKLQLNPYKQYRPKKATTA